MSSAAQQGQADGHGVRNNMGSVRQQSQASGKNTSGSFDGYLEANQTQDQYKAAFVCSSIFVGMVMRCGAPASGMVNWVRGHCGVPPELGTPESPRHDLTQAWSCGAPGPIEADSGVGTDETYQCPWWPLYL